MAVALGFPTLAHALDAHARERPDATFLVFHRGSEQVESWTFLETFSRARACAAGMHERGVAAGEVVIIVGGNDAATVTLLLGCMLKGAAAAIVHAPLRAGPDAAREHLCRVVAQARPALVVAAPQLWPAKEQRQGALYCARDELVRADRADFEVHLPDPADTAYLQFSSGTTGPQKAVALSYAAQSANAWATGRAIDIRADERWLNWLPLYHDMGLMAGVLIPLFWGNTTHLLSPACFLERPIAWLEALSQVRATLTVAPNFAYALVARRATSERVMALDLSSLRLAFNGAEMVLPETIERFESALRPAGLAPNTVYPVYGLAECTLSAVFWHPQTRVRVDTVRRKALAKNRAEPAGEEESDVVRLVSVGRPVPGHRLRIVDADERPCLQREVGEIQLSGPSCMQGYWDDEQKSRAALAGGWLRTGDLGYLVDQELFVCGRKKNVVVRFGENFFPAELEALTARAPGVKPGRLAVFGVEDVEMATERVWLVIETEKPPREAEAFARGVRDFVTTSSGFRFDGVSAVPLGFVEKTSSGKLRRFACRDKLARLFESGLEPPSIGRWPRQLEMS